MQCSCGGSTANKPVIRYGEIAGEYEQCTACGRIAWRHISEELKLELFGEKNMAVIQSRTLYGGFTPVCSSCGVCESWDISSQEYRSMEKYWDDWECDECNPMAKGKRFITQAVERILRGYQQRGLDELRQAVRDGFRRILLVLPTGGGKSVIFSKLIQSANQKGNPVLFLVHKRELVYQASDHMDKEGVQHGIIMAGEPMNKMKQVQLASTLTLWTRAKRHERIDMPPAKVVVVDEAHRTGSKTYNQILDDYDDSILIGVTATPVRKNGRGLGNQFEKMIVISSISELQELGFLCQVEYMVPNIPDLSEVDINDGEFVEEQLQEVMDNKHLVGNIVDHYIKFAKGRQAVLFAAGVRHSIHLRDRFRMKGIAAEHIDANTNTAERDEIHDRFEKGEIQVICNYAIYTEGVDMPELSCVINARPSRSIVFHLQSIGRGLRPKKDGGNCLVIDHSGNVLRMGPVEMDHEWSLDEFEVIYDRDASNEERKEREKKETEYICSNCGTMFESEPRCPTCGEPLAKIGRDIKVAKGELTLYKPKLKKKDKEPSKEEKQLWYSMFLHYAKSKSYQDGWVSHKYKEKFGVWPRDMKRSPIPPSVEFNNYMKYLRIKYIKQQEKKRHEQP